MLTLMSEAARNLDDGENLSTKEEMNALENQEAGSDEVLKIRHIKGDLRQQIGDADDIFTKKDRERWEKEIEETAKKVDLEALKEVGKQIADERKKIEEATRDYVVEMEQNKEAFTKDPSRNVDTIKEYLDHFRKQSYEEKKRLKTKLQADINGRLVLLEELKKLAPEREDEIQSMRRHERKELRDELRKNMEPHQKAIEDFMAFPDEFRKIRRPDFMKLGLTGKQKILEDMKTTLNNRYEDKISKAAADRSLSPTEINDARSYFKEAPITGPFGRINALKMLDSHLKVAREKTKEFADLIGELPTKDPFRLASQYSLRFYNSPYEVRSELCAELKAKIDILNTHLNNKYFGLLDSYRDRQIISPQTHLKFMMWFSMQPLKEKPANLELLGDDKGNHKNAALGNETQIKRYIEVFNKFDSLPPALQTKYRSEFYRGGYTERNATMKKIIDTEEMAAPLKQEGNASQSTDNAMKDGTTEGQNSPQNGIDNKPGLENKSDEDLLQIIKEGENARAVLEARMIYTTLTELAEAANDNALINERKKDASERNSGLTGEEAELQKELSDHTLRNNRSEKTLKRNKNSGKIVAADVIKIDAKKIGEKSPEEILKLKRKATEVQRGGEKEKLATSEVEFNNEGNTVGTQSGLEESKKQGDALDKMVIKTAEQQLERQGRKIDAGDRKRLIELSKKRDKKVKLETDAK